MKGDNIEAYIARALAFHFAAVSLWRPILTNPRWANGYHPQPAHHTDTGRTHRHIYLHRINSYSIR